MSAKSATKPDQLRQQEEIFGILLMTLALLILLSLVSYDPSEEPAGFRMPNVQNAMGSIGVYISYYLIKFFIGYSSIVVPFLLFAWGWNRFRGNDPHKLLRASLFTLGMSIYIATILGLPHAVNPDNYQFGFDFSGLVGGFLATTLFTLFGEWGSIIVLISIGMITLITTTQLSFARLLLQVSRGLSHVVRTVRKLVSSVSLPAVPGRSDKPANARPLPPRPPMARDDGLRAPLRPPEDPGPPRPELERLPLHKKIRRIGESDATGEFDAPLPSREQPARPAPPPPAFQREPFEPAEPSPFDDELSDIHVSTRADIEPPRTDDQLPGPIALGNYVMPGLDLLHYPGDQVTIFSEEEQRQNGNLLERRLEEFGVSGKVVDVHPGPVITRYEYEPAPGIKISRITSLADDLALAMRAKRIRVVAPIPGKAAVGIEIPNQNPETVYLRSILDSDKFRQSKSPLTIALGKEISGKPYVTQLDRMPHLLVAGSTGSGKSVCLNAIITSILYCAHPTEVKFVLIDPKRLELSLYKDLLNHHLIFREDLDETVVTNPPNSLAVLRSLEYEMEQRYDLFATAGVRNIEDYNQRVRSGRITGTEEEPAVPLPYIVVVIDELADLMLMAAKEVEEPIARLTQMARAIGIHLIVATQRPSVDVITGVIKANFPARIAFAVASKTDSRTILDMNGAEKLLGRGDMLFLPPGSPEPLRIHGALIEVEEIEQVIAHIQRQPRYPRKLLPIKEEEAVDNVSGISGPGQRDELFKEALKLVVRHQQGSISLLQRRLKVGYARAARLIDELEAAGIVGGFDGSKAREVLIDEEYLEQLDLDSL